MCEVYMQNLEVTDYVQIIRVKHPRIFNEKAKNEIEARYHMSNKVFDTDRRIHLREKMIEKMNKMLNF